MIFNSLKRSLSKNIKFANFLNNKNNNFMKKLIFKDTILKYSRVSFSILNKMEDSLEIKFKNIGLSDKTITELKTKKKLADRLKFVLQEGEIESCEKEVGHIIFLIAEKLNPAYNHRLPLLLKYATSKKFIISHQLDAAVEFLKEKGDLQITEEEFEKRAGIGLIITEEDIRNEVQNQLKKNSSQILKERYKYAYINILYEVKKSFAYLDGKLAKKVLEEEFEKFLGGKNSEEKEEDSLRQEAEDLKKKSKDKAKFTKEEANRMEEIKNKLKQIDEAHKKIKEVEEEKPEKDKLASLMARDMKSAMNPPHILKKHIEFTKGKVFTRFPPEPNGYLHIGHAKAMRFSFTSAEANGGSCYLRYDDTNPEKETREFITNIEENVRWLGYQPWKITYASEYFEDLYHLAEELIKKGKAYVCHQTKQEMNEYRDKKLDSPFRNRSVEENLKLFEMMRQGRFEEKECCLRMKIDMKHNNPCMRDPVAYRIKYVPHPHAGNKWCIYPTYDYTHCLNDSLENITHSLCTLEFEIRRDSYYWLLEALDLYRPFVWEYSRLNLTKNVLSKRKLTQLVNGKYVRGWDDPRLLTVNGLRRKGYTSEAINTFVDTIGVTRRGNDNVLSIKVLEHCIRTDLDKKAPRTLAVIDPIKVTLVNLNDDFSEEFETPLYPKNKELGSRKVYLTNTIFIEKTDFKEKEDPDFFGLTPGQSAGLKYAGFITLKEVKKDSKGEVTELICEYSPETKKLKGRIHWISQKDAARVEVRLYDYLWTVDEPMSLKEPLVELNPNSLIIKDHSLVNRSILINLKHSDHFQFERLGYFSCDYDTDVKANRFVFNLTIDLGDEKNKKF